MNVHDWLADRTILEVVHGSHAYGLNIATSDVDIKGVCIPPSAYRDGFLYKFEQAETHAPDRVIFDIRKFMFLAAECNPSVIEVLFGDASDIIKCSAAGQRLRAAGSQFLSKKAKHTYSGYAHQQLKRIKTHYRWNHSDIRKPLRADFNLPERTVIPADQLAAAMSAVTKKLTEWEFGSLGLDELGEATKIRLAEIVAEMTLASDDRWLAASRCVGLTDNFIELLDMERRYNSQMKEWDNYQKWLADRNPERAALEAAHGFDTKHGMHLFRLLRMGREIMTKAKVYVKRVYDRDEMLSIRFGAWSYERLVDWAEGEMKALDELYKTCTILPNAPDKVALSNLCEELTHEYR
jgi:uncharacterized protein